MESSRDVMKGCDVGSCSDPLTRTVKSENMFSSDSSSSNQCAALLEDLSSQRKTVKDLHLELEEERNAAASAANETMSVILRLQREKSEIQMEARQFKAFAEETMTHEQEKVSALEELVYEKEQAIEALSYEVEAYKGILLSYGVTEAEMHDSTVGIDDYPCEYTSLRCSVDDENPSGLDGDVEVVEKVMVGLGQSYYDSNSPLGTAKEVKGIFSVDSPVSTCSDRVYTVDEELSKMSKGTLNGDQWKSLSQQRVNEPDIEKLYTRLQALEADRESLRQVIVSMRTDQAQLVLLKEIAQHLSKDTATRQNPVSKMPFLKAFSVGTVFKWIVSFVSWRGKGKQNKYVYNLPANNMGMLMILGEGCQTRRWSCITSSHV
ncbi:GTD-binding domain-containing protein [Hirschfeldia incana]|nr:GTD-binding domain-containing protein [Hirschfeldia incana]KAJ0245743.1 GTD-binding domain-containing protein [Hirschfeldia incana]